MAKLAEGADILVHEAMYLPALEKYLRERIAKGAPTNFESFIAHMKADHSPVEDVGRIAQKAGVKTLVLSHLTPGIDGISDDLWRMVRRSISQERLSSERILWSYEDLERR